MEKITEKTIFNLIPDKSFVKYAGADYKVAGFTKRVNDWFIEIYDEPPSEHIDLVKAESCELLEPSEQKHYSENSELGGRFTEKDVSKRTTAEEIWDQLVYTQHLESGDEAYVIERVDFIKAMQEYSHLQNKQLTEKNRELEEYKRLNTISLSGYTPEELHDKISTLQDRVRELEKELRQYQSPSLDVKK